VKAVAVATVFGVPVKAPVDVLKLIPGGVALIPKLAIVPPVDVAIVNPVAAVFTVLLSDAEERVKAGAARAAVTVKVNVCVEEAVAFVAVIVKTVDVAIVVGVPVSAPVVVLKIIPGEVALIPKLAIAPPVELLVNPVAAVFTVLLSDDELRVKAGAARVGPDGGTVGRNIIISLTGVVIWSDAFEAVDAPFLLLAVMVNV
jgi:hypothetical protein